MHLSMAPSMDMCIAPSLNALIHGPFNGYVYKVKIFNPKIKSQFIVCQIHCLNGSFSSIPNIQEILSNYLNQDVSGGTPNVILGILKAAPPNKTSVRGDLTTMYDKFPLVSDVFLWCDGRESDSDSQGTK